MALEKAPFREKNPHAVRGKRPSFFFFSFFPRLGRGRFLVGGIRWGRSKAGCYFVVFSLIGRCGVPINLFLDAGMFRERGRMENGGKRKGNKCETRKGGKIYSFAVISILHIYFYLFNRARGTFDTPGKRKEKKLLRYGVWAGRAKAVVFFSLKIKSLGSFGLWSLLIGYEDSYNSKNGRQLSSLSIQLGRVGNYNIKSFLNPFFGGGGRDTEY